MSTAKYNTKEDALGRGLSREEVDKIIIYFLLD